MTPRRHGRWVVPRPACHRGAEIGGWLVAIVEVPGEAVPVSQTNGVGAPDSADQVKRQEGILQRSVLRPDPEALAPDAPMLPGVL